MKQLIVAVFTITILFLAGCGEKKAENVPVGEMTAYRDPGYGFSIKYPKDWKQLGTVGKAVFAKSEDVVLRFQDFKSGEPGGMVTVTVVEYKGHTPVDVMGSTNDELKTYAQVKPEQQVQVAGKQASRVDYYYQATRKYQVQGYVVYVPGDTALYSIDFKGYGDQFDAHQAVFTAVLNSFELPVITSKKSDVWVPKPPVEYTNSPFFTMQYPEDMEFTPTKKTGDRDFVIEMHAPDRQDCSIHIDVFPAKKLNVDKVWEQNKGHYRALGTGKSTIDGLAAYWVDYPGAKDVSSRAYFTVKNDKVIRVTVNWYSPKKDVYFTALEKIVNSIKLK